MFFEDPADVGCIDCRQTAFSDEFVRHSETVVFWVAIRYINGEVFFIILRLFNRAIDYDRYRLAWLNCSKTWINKEWAVIQSDLIGFLLVATSSSLFQKTMSRHCAIARTNALARVQILKDRVLRLCVSHFLQRISEVEFSFILDRKVSTSLGRNEHCAEVDIRSGSNVVLRKDRLRRDLDRNRGNRIVAVY